MTTSEALEQMPRGNLSAHAVVVTGAAMIAGVLAAMEVSPLLAFPTLLVTFLLGREALRTAIAQPPAVAFPEFPESLRETVDHSMAALPDGEALRLLSKSLAQARSLLAPHEGALDDRQETATRENILSLINACCYTALELARLDAASGARNPSPDPDATNQTAAARELLVGRLSSAAAALTSLYVAGVMHGSPASDAVAQLAEEINADARARTAAATEISALLGDVPPLEHGGSSA
jgi:hypothetical protein